MIENTHNDTGYNKYLREYMDDSTEKLKEILQDWEKKHWCIRGFLAVYTPFFIDWALRNDVIKDLINARENPDGVVAKRIFPILEGWRAERLRSSGGYMYIVKNGNR